MAAVFDLDHAELAADPRFAALARALDAHPRIDSGASFNRYCRDACRIWKEQFGEGIGETSATFAELLRRVERGGEEVIPTSWGGVVITRHEPPQVEKYLVIREGGYLALETHEEKDERLEVREGAGLLLWRAGADPRLTVRALAPGAGFHFEPGREHCLVGTEDLLVFERSTDPKGMDQDLVFLYEPDGNR
jgi:hypothetical protein